LRMDGLAANCSAPQVRDELIAALVPSSDAPPRTARARGSSALRLPKPRKASKYTPPGAPFPAPRRRRRKALDIADTRRVEAHNSDPLVTVPLLALSPVPAASRYRANARDLLALTKPRITTIVLATGGAGMALAPGTIDRPQLLLSLVGTVLVVSAANALNMWWEREIDGKMRRTAQRPLPSGRMGDSAALLFGLLLGAVSVPMLFAVNAATGALGLLALVSYVAIYTPLKQHSPFALQVGAVPGAIPPLLGWTSVTGHLDTSGLVLFAIMFLWQIPHFVAISLFRAEDYARAGLKVHAVARGVRSSKATILVYTLCLVAFTVLPVPFGIAGSGTWELHSYRGYYLSFLAFWATERTRCRATTYVGRATCSVTRLST
jgi:heme o synthase